MNYQQYEQHEFQLIDLPRTSSYELLFEIVGQPFNKLLLLQLL